MSIEFSADSLSPHQRYKLLAALVFPRPIAQVSTYSANGVANCAPYSFFNAMCEDPMLLVVSFGPRVDGLGKHSLNNLLRTGSFIVNLVDEGIANGMHLSSQEVGEEVSEFELAGFTPIAGTKVPHPRIAQAPVSFECRLYQHIDIGTMRCIVLGEVVHMHLREGIVDLDKMYVSDELFKPVGRLYANRYCTTRQRFKLPGELP